VDAEAEAKKRESSDNKEKHTRGGVIDKTKITQDDLIDGGDDDAQKTTALLLKIAELIEGVATIRDEDFQAISRIEAHVSLLIDSIADKSDADGPEKDQAPNSSGTEQNQAPDAGEPEQDRSTESNQPEQAQAPDEPAVGGSEQAAAADEQDSVGPDRPPVADGSEAGEIL
jgi:hypothetical protein